jgi:hypothetical protein
MNPLGSGPPYAKGYDADVMVQIEGVVLASHISPIDNPINHTHGNAGDVPRIHHDWSIHIAPDAQYQKLLSDANMLEGGKMELEWEIADHLTNGGTVLVPANPMTDGMTADAVPAVGDRVAIRGRFIFDCGHPPYRTEIHPIDSIAVIHGRERVKWRYSQFGGSTWFQPADVNLPLNGAERADEKIGDLVGTLTKLPNVTGWGPFNDAVAQIDRITNILGSVSFVTDGCQRQYDTELIGPPNAAYFPYEHAMLDKFNGHSTTPTMSFPRTLPYNWDAYSFLVGGVQIVLPMPLAEFPQARPTSIIYDPTKNSASSGPKQYDVCFVRTVLRKHDNTDPSQLFCSTWISPGTPGGCCQVDTTDDLVTYVTAADQTRLYAEGGSNCLRVSMWKGDTLHVGSHGFECDFSCGERWDDPDFAGAADERIGVTRAAFTAARNFGASGGPYTLLSQPDLGTAYSRTQTNRDYKMTVTVTEVVIP